MFLKTMFYVLATVLLLIGLGACTQSDNPSQVIESYLAALVANDEVLAVNLSCAAWEEQAKAEGEAFKGVESNLEGPDCQTIDENTESASVNCTGEIIFVYAGGEDQTLELKHRTFSAVKEAGEWKMCGYK
jgi:hypothetical protein